MHGTDSTEGWGLTSLEEGNRVFIKLGHKALL